MEIRKSDREKILGNGNKIYIEAGVSTGWKSFFDESLNFIGVKPLERVVQKMMFIKSFNISVENLIKTTKH